MYQGVEGITADPLEMLVDLIATTNLTNPTWVWTMRIPVGVMLTVECLHYPSQTVKCQHPLVKLGLGIKMRLHPFKEGIVGGNVHNPPFLKYDTPPMENNDREDV